MKITKILTLSMLLGGVAVLASCGNNASSTQSNASSTQSVDYMERINAALAEVKVPSEIDSNFTVMTSGMGGVKFSWTSSNPAVISINGGNAVVTPSEESDVTVTLTVTASLEGQSASKDFSVVVKQKVIDADYISITEAYAAAVGETVTVRGVVSQMMATSSQYTTAGGFYLSDNENAIYVYGSQVASSVSLGDEIIVSGVTATYPDDLGRVTQIASPTLIEIVGSGRSTNVDASKLEVKTVAEIASCTDYTHYAKVYYFKDVMINKYVTTYTSYSLVDYADDINFSSAPKINFYSGQGDAGCPEFAWLDEYTSGSKSGEQRVKVDIVFAVNSKNSSGKWRGAPIQIVNHTTVTEGSVPSGSTSGGDTTSTETSSTPSNFVLPSGLSHQGTQADPFSVADAIKVAQAAGETATPEQYYIKGVVSSLDASGAAQYGNISLDVTDEGGSDVFKAYRLYDTDGKFTAETAARVTVGCTIVFKGNIVNFKGNTPETTQGCTLIEVIA